METRFKPYAAAFVAIMLTAMSADAAVTQETKCQRERFKQAGDYAACAYNAFSSGVNQFNVTKCAAKYGATWLEKLKNKYDNPPGTSCSEPASRFVDNGDGTITDNLTRLVWEQKDSADDVADLGNPHDVDNQYTLSATNGFDEDGTAYTDIIATLNAACFAGHCDWRVPTFLELMTLLTLPAGSCPIGCIDPVFVSGTERYWSSSTQHLGNELPVDSNASAWFVEFHHAGVGGNNKRTNLHHVRAVSGGL